MLMPVAPPTLPSREPSPFPPSAIDRANIQKPDDEFKPHSWSDAERIIAENRLELFKRWPSDVRKYVDWSRGIKVKYGSVQKFVIKERLGWTLSSRTTENSGPLFDCASPIPFRDASDYKTLPNDWPYGFEPGYQNSLTCQITHLIVWLKTQLEPEPLRGDMTPTGRLQVEEFVQWNFVDRIKHLPDYQHKIRWFKNWTALQSVPGMDHIHVLVRNVPAEIIDEWVGGEAILSDREVPEY